MRQRKGLTLATDHEAVWSCVACLAAWNDIGKNMSITEKLKSCIESCGRIDDDVLNHKVDGEQYRHELLQLLEILKVMEEVYGTDAMCFCGRDEC